MTWFTPVINLLAKLLEIVTTVLVPFMLGKSRAERKAAKDELAKRTEADRIRDRVRGDPDYRDRVRERFRDK